MVIRVPVRQAKGEAMAMIEGREYRTRRATWYRGTRFSRISLAIRRSWLTKKIKKKNKKQTQKVKRISRAM
jgi:hypothetical protein